jgi:hypothetical protein
LRIRVMPRAKRILQAAFALAELHGDLRERHPR